MSDYDATQAFIDEFGFDPWETSTGLADEITLRVDNPHFGYDSGYQDGQTPLFFLEGTVIGGDADPEFSQFYSIGTGWEVVQNGKAIAREKGKNTKLNRNTNYSHLFVSLREAAVKQGLDTEIRRRGNPQNVQLWQGLELYLEREDYDWTPRGETEKREGTRLLVKTIEKIPEASQRNRVRGTEATKAAEPPTTGDLPMPLKVRLRKLAQTVKAGGGSHATFAEQAFSDVDGVLDNASAEDAVMDQEPGSIWAEA